VTIDPTGRLAGRGAYVCRSGDCLEKALTKGALSRALRTPLPADLRASLAGRITIDIIDTEGGSRGQE
jgi:predicted RNA-binding protein YlxR (DUF448 family)